MHATSNYLFTVKLMGLRCRLSVV